MKLFPIFTLALKMKRFFDGNNEVYSLLIIVRRSDLFDGICLRSTFSTFLPHPCDSFDLLRLLMFCHDSIDAFSVK